MENINTNLREYVLLQHCPDGWKLSKDKSTDNKTVLEYKYRKDKRRYVVIYASIEDGYISFHVNKSVLSQMEAETMCGVVSRFAIKLSNYYRLK